jgi:uncharacterized delta-60 repeat protein
MKLVRHLAALAIGVAASHAALAAPAGALDPTFADAGIRSIPFDRGGNQSDRGWASAQAPDGRLYVAGQVALSAQTTGIGIARLMPDGQLDASYLDGQGQAGRISYLPSGYSKAVPDTILPMANGHLLVAGSARATGADHDVLMLCRFDENGVVVSGFGAAPADGCAMLDVGSTGEAALTGVVQDSQGNIVVAGYATFTGAQRALLARFYQSGQLINTFGSGGIRFPSFPAWAEQTRFNDLAFSPDDRLVAVGMIQAENVDRDFLVAKFNWVTGGFDTSFFAGSGFKQIDFLPDVIGDDEAVAVHVLADNTIIAAGNAVNASNQLRPAIARLTANGGFVAGFGGNATGTPVYSACDFCDKQATSLVRLENGKIALGGWVGISGLPETNDFFALMLSSTGIPENGYGGDAFDVGTARVDITGAQDMGAGILAQGQRLLVAGVARYPGVQAENFAMIRLDHGLGADPDFIHTVTPNAGFNGQVSPANPQQVVDSGYKMFTITPNDGFSVSEILGTCPGSLIGLEYYVGPVTGNCQFTVNFGADVTLAYHAGEHGTIVGPALQVVPYNGNGEMVVAQADEGYSFVGWSDGYNWYARQDMNVTQDIDVTATFAPSVYEVTPLYGMGGATTPAGTQMVPHGEQALFTIQPDPGFGLASINAGCAGGLVGNVYATAAVEANCSIEILFAASNAMYDLNYAGSETCQVVGQTQQAVQSGFDGLPVTVEPADGQVFVQWSDGSIANPRQDTHVFTDIDVVAQCAPAGTEIHTVTPKFNTGGVLAPPSPQLVADGETTQFEIKPNPGYGLVGIEGCGGVRVGNVFITGQVVADCAVTAEFATDTNNYTLEYAADQGCTLVGTTAQSVAAGNSGEPVSVQAQPGSFFIQWSDGSTENPRTDSNVFENISVIAQCAVNGTPVHTVTTEVVSGDGAFAPLGPQQVAEGETIAFDLLPGEGFVIGSVSGCGGGLVGSTYTTAPINGSCTIQATFIASDETFQLNYAAEVGEGTVLGPAQQVVVAGGTGEPVEAMALNGFFFVQWSDGVATAARQDANVIGNIDVTAQFAANGTTIHTVTPVAGVGGGFVPDTAQQVAEGDTAQFQVVPWPGYAIDTVSGCGAGNLQNGVYTTAAITGDCEVTATFYNDRIFYDGFEMSPP